MGCVQAAELAKSKLEKVKRLQQQAHRDWQEIKHGSLKFQRRQQEADAIRSLHKSDLVAFFKVRRTACSPGRLAPYGISITHTRWKQENCMCAMAVRLASICQQLVAATANSNESDKLN